MLALLFNFMEYLDLLAELVLRGVAMLVLRPVSLDVMGLKCKRAS